MIIPESYPKDAGTYTITAKNLAGEAYSTCHVSVKGRLPNETSDSEMASDSDPIKPSVQLPLKDVVSVFEGKPVRLDCIIVGQPEPEVIWYHNERPVKESDDVQLLFQGDRCSLLIHEAYLEDAGNYRVVAINSGGEASSVCELSVTPLNIAEPATRNDKNSAATAVNNQPKFEKFLSDVLVQEGDSVTLDCVAKDVTEVKWFLTNNEISPNDRIKVSSDTEKGEHKITIDKVTADDKGVYTVKVTNANGESKCFAQLIVKSVNVQSPSDIEKSEPKLVCPTFKELFTHKNVHLGESVKFECIVNGEPAPKIEWFFNDKLIEGDKFVASKDGDQEVLTIAEVLEESAGKIACVAENDIGKATCVAYLNLVANGVVAPEPAAEVQSISQEHNTESSKVTIKKQVFTTTSTSEVNSYEGNIEQVTNEVTREEKTNEIKNKEESSEQQIAVEVVQKSDSVTSIQSSTRKQKAPKFLAELISKIVDSGVNITMEASYEGFPSPEIKVLKNGESLLDTEKLHITNKLNKVTIQIDDVNNADAGRYSVVATNPMGESTCTADVVVKSK